jgi:hypothetical protein
MKVIWDFFLNLKVKEPIGFGFFESPISLGFNQVNYFMGKQHVIYHSSLVQRT